MLVGSDDPSTTHDENDAEKEEKNNFSAEEKLTHDHPPHAYALALHLKACIACTILATINILMEESKIISSSKTYTAVMLQVLRMKTLSGTL